MSGKYRLLLAFWGALFLASALIMVVSLRSLRNESGRFLPHFPIVPPDNMEITSIQPGDKPGDPEDDGSARWSLALATVSAFVSTAGFMATTYFAQRNDRRQTAITELEVQKLANEIERQRLEIDKLRREQASHAKT